MVNNFDLIRDRLVFPNERSFYFIQILKRSKDNPGMKSYSRPIETFYVRSVEHFDRYMPHIIEKCEQNNARAYIKMNPLDMMKVGLRMVCIIGHELARGNWWNIISALNSACGQGGIVEKEDKDAKDKKDTYSGGDVHVEGTSKLWLIDIDNISENDDENKAFRQEVADFINTLQPLTVKKTGEPITNKVMMEVPTKNGVHLLTTSFDIKTFRERYRGENDKEIDENDNRKVVDVHKEGNTILYIP